VLVYLSQVAAPPSKLEPVPLLSNHSVLQRCQSHVPRLLAYDMMPYGPVDVYRIFRSRPTLFLVTLTVT